MANGNEDLSTYVGADIEDKKDGSPRIIRGIQRLDQFVKLAPLLYGVEDVIFRGQRRDWPLVPTVGRVCKGKKWFSVEQEVFREFKREAVPYLRVTPVNDWQWLAVAQHNRLPTRLLDWSKNPLVALWFAVSEPGHEGESGIVWAHCYKPSEAISTTKDLATPFSVDETLVYLPEHVFPHIQAQSGVFTVHPRRAGDDHFVPFERTKDAGLTKIEISKDFFPLLRYYLFRLGINPASLFPGLSGVVDRIKFQNEFLEDEEGDTW
jgi:hypothetical protein